MYDFVINMCITYQQIFHISW